jgi:hypothetical protein
MTTETKANAVVGADDITRVISLIALIAVPWIALLILLYFVQAGTGSSGWSGAMKFALLVLLALLMVLYERGFITVARSGIPEPGQTSQYTFDKVNFLRLPTDPAVSAALEAWCTSRSVAR